MNSFNIALLTNGSLTPTFQIGRLFWHIVASSAVSNQIAALWNGIYSAAVFIFEQKFI